MLLDSAPPGLAYRVVRDFAPIVVHDAARFRADGEGDSRDPGVRIARRAPGSQMQDGTCRVPYRELFSALAERDLMPRDLADRLAAASAFRNLVAHRYGALEGSRLHSLARPHVARPPVPTSARRTLQIARRTLSAPRPHVV